MGESIADGARSRLAVIVALLAASLGAAACSHTPTPAPDVKYVEYLVGPPDRLSITVLPDPPVVENVVVRPDGMITIQLVGDVPAGGKTTDEIAADIQNLSLIHI